MNILATVGGEHVMLITSIIMALFLIAIGGVLAWVLRLPRQDVSTLRPEPGPERSHHCTRCGAALPDIMIKACPYCKGDTCAMMSDMEANATFKRFQRQIRAPTERIEPVPK